MTSPAHT
jgi:hypothetical protein